MITGKLHQEGKNGGGRELYLRQSTESCIKDVFPKEICIITKKIKQTKKLVVEDVDDEREGDGDGGGRKAGGGCHSLPLLWATTALEA